MEPCIDEMNCPVVDITAFRIQLPSSVSKHKVSVTIAVIIKEEFFDHFSLISQAQNKLLMTEMSVILHQVPNNRPIAYIHEWFWYDIRMIPKSGAESSTEQYDLHFLLTSAVNSDGASATP
jgi:hypothetical protein